MGVPVRLALMAKQTLAMAADDRHNLVMEKTTAIRTRA